MIHLVGTCSCTHIPCSPPTVLLALSSGIFTRARLTRVSLNDRWTPWWTARGWLMASQRPSSTLGTIPLALVRCMSFVPAIAYCSSHRTIVVGARACKMQPVGHRNARGLVHTGHLRVFSSLVDSATHSLACSAHQRTLVHSPRPLSHSHTLTLAPGADDCWQDCLSPDSLNGSFHNAAGKPLVDASRFPKGLRALSDYGAAKGIGLGWCVAHRACARPTARVSLGLCVDG